MHPRVRRPPDHPGPHHGAELPERPGGAEAARRHQPHVVRVHHDLHQRAVPGHRVHLRGVPGRLRQLPPARADHRVHRGVPGVLLLHLRAPARLPVLARRPHPDHLQRVPGRVRGVLQLVPAADGGRLARGGGGQGGGGAGAQDGRGRVRGAGEGGQRVQLQGHDVGVRGRHRLHHRVVHRGHRVQLPRHGRLLGAGRRRQPVRRVVVCVLPVRLCAHPRPPGAAHPAGRQPDVRGLGAHLPPALLRGQVPARHGLVPGAVLHLQRRVRHHRHRVGALRQPRAVPGHHPAHHALRHGAAVRRRGGLAVVQVPGVQQLEHQGHPGHQPVLPGLAAHVGLRGVLHHGVRAAQARRAVRAGRVVRAVPGQRAGVRARAVQRADPRRARGGHVRAVRDHGQGIVVAGADGSQRDSAGDRKHPPGADISVGRYGAAGGGVALLGPEQR
mmetsp:Transcript_7067/g.18010  ORF Transcript_7067/g.18010 Transcript_7067/m.18010 type:complete len:443 (-) Transcript_7067:35-1363(-)